MQHHVHANAVRRATHHHGHHQNLGHAHHMAMHPSLEQQPPPPQPQQPQAAHARLNHHHQQQQQHQQPGTGGTAVYHHNNAGNINGSSNNNNNNNNNNNSNNNQMQKIRQQHQHLNNNNNNNNNNIGNNNNSNSSNGHSGKCHNHPPPPLPQAYNQLTYNQLPPPPPPGTHPQHPHMAAAHLSSYAPHPPPPTHYYMSQAKPSKYNNNNNSNNNAHYSANTNNNNNSSSNSNSTNYAPKTILQNTYRQSKVNGQQLSAHSVQEANSNNIIIATEAVVVAAAGAAGEETIEQCPVGPPPPPQLSELPVEIPIDGDKCSSSSSLSTDIQPQIDSTLPNEDHGVSASGRNGKDKTPMCLVNELARYNKITHQYRLTGERGPAHCKTFTVTLKLGDEEYSADGFKIKKAQHLAASKAIEETKYKHPPPKIRRSESEGSSSRTHITPTVELNALAMKLGQRTYYLLDPTQIPPADAAMQMPLPPEYGGVSLLPTPATAAAAAAAAAAGLTQQQQQQQPQQQPISIAPPPPAFIRRQFVQLGGPPMHPHGIYGGHQRTGQYPAKYHASRYALPPPPPHLMHGAYGAHHTPMPVTPSKITLFVGKQKFVGTGRTLQQAKHDAAARALQVLKTQASATATSASDEALEDSMDEGDKKSPISQVHEIGIKRSMTVHFKVLREEGPAHMKNFITACIVGSIVTEGEGNGKKISKKRSAEKMLIELHKLPPLTPTKQTPMKRIKVKTPGKNSSSSGTATTDPTATPLPGKLERRKRLSAPNKEKLLEQLDDAENPITKLIQLQQNRKDKEPIFELIAKNGNDTSRRREFVMEVSANGSTARGTGNSKKLAKRNAAQALLELLEAAEPAVNVKSQNTKETSITATGATKDLVTVAAGVDVPMVSTPAGPVPGILILRQNKKPSKKKASMEAKEDGKEKGKESTTKTAPAAATTTVTAAATVTTPTAVVTAATEAAGTTNVAANATETSSSESLLNTSTGSNTSGVSSNSSNTGTTTKSTSTSNTTSNSNSNSSTSSSNIAGVHMKEQLLYLSKLLDFEVNFSDYPKGNHNEFLTIVTLSTNPPQICHGVGKSSEESQNDAARSALKILSELGLNNAKK